MRVACYGAETFVEREVGARETSSRHRNREQIRRLEQEARELDLETAALTRALADERDRATNAQHACAANDGALHAELSSCLSQLDWKRRTSPATAPCHCVAGDPRLGPADRGWASYAPHWARLLDGELYAAQPRGIGLASCAGHRRECEGRRGRE